MNCSRVLTVYEFEQSYLQRFSQPFRTYYNGLRAAKKISKTTVIHLYKGTSLIARAALDDIYEDAQVIASANPRARTLRNSMVILEKR